MNRHCRVIVIEAGFGGLNAVKELVVAPVDVLLVDANNFHTFSPLLYQVATAGLDADDIAFPPRGIFHRQATADFRMGRVTTIDVANHEIELADGTRLGYDHLIV